MNPIKINFINHSNDSDNECFIFVQKNKEESTKSNIAAWTVINHCSPGDSHSFTYSPNITISITDSSGHTTDQLSTEVGQAFIVQDTPAGVSINLSDQPSADKHDIEISNLMEKGSVEVNIFRDGKLLACKSNLIPSENAFVNFEPTLLVGAIDEVKEGSIIDPSILSNLKTEFSLEGLQSCDIIVTGGGTGPSATAFTFTLSNVLYA